MAHPHEEVVRRGYDAFSRGDMETLRELFTDDAVWHAPGRSPLSGDHRGIEQVLGYFTGTMERSGGNFQVRLHDVLANDDHAVGLHFVVADREGKHLEDQQALIFHFRDGKIAEVWQHLGDAYANDEFWA